MSKFEIEFYVGSSGVSFTVPLASEEHCRLAKVFLWKSGKMPAYQSDQTRPDLYYLESRQEVDAFYDFIRSIKAQKS